ncbi:hypothetical protein N7470_000624 [Penicillium chermesinum]|nr:hypothetical protein N7470_000624 [Penicillium chermesinum]
MVELVFYPVYGSNYGVLWPGPDPLSDRTLSADLFSTATLLAREETEWIELRLCGSYSREIESGDPQVFFLPQTETALSNLPRVRHQIREIISNTLLWSQAMLHFRLAIYLHGKGPLSSPVHTTSTRWSGASATSNLLDPEWFVLNIDANFDSRASSVAEKEGGMDKLQ